VLLFDCGHDPSTAFTDRRLFLTKDNPTVAIGRTSKRDATLEQAQSNAWIDSAVMSRHHAKLELDVANKVSPLRRIKKSSELTHECSKCSSLTSDLFTGLTSTGSSLPQICPSLWLKTIC